MKLNETHKPFSVVDYREREGILLKDLYVGNSNNLELAHLGLTSLEGCPSHCDNLWASDNYLTSLEGLPETILKTCGVGGNLLTSLKDIHLHIKKMDNGTIWAPRNPIKSHVLGVLLIPGFLSLRMANSLPEEPVWVKIINRHAAVQDKSAREKLFDCHEEMVERELHAYAQV